MIKDVPVSESRQPVRADSDEAAPLMVGDLLEIADIQGLMARSVGVSTRVCEIACDGKQA